MTAAPSIADVTSYLFATGWRLRPEGWRGAAIWSSGDAEVLVPPGDDVGDAELRIRELIVCLAVFEARDPSDVLRDIGSPLVDSATYRMLADDATPASLSLPAGVRVVEGIRRIVATAARTVVQGPQLSFSGHAPEPVTQLLRSARLDTSWHDGFSLTVGISLVSDPVLGRSVATQLYDATTAVDESVERGGAAALDQVAAAGVSVDFCTALSDLAGDGRTASFQLGFRWAHRVPTELPTRVLTFPSGSGELIRRTSRRLSRLDLPGPATVTGRVESLHDNPDGERWRVRIRGDLRTDRGVVTQRGVWVRLHGPTAYDLAIAAHREDWVVRVTGFRDVSGARQDLAIPPDGLVVVDGRAEEHPDRGLAP
jgi:hypothetical protein